MTAAPWSLPESTVIGGQTYRFHTDFRDILNILGWLNGDLGRDLCDEERCYVALRLFYPEFAQMPAPHWQQAAAEMAQFLAGGRAEPERPGPRLLDWQQDAPLILAGVNRAAGCEVRSLPALHWWTFLTWFDAIGDGPLATVVAIRDKLRRGKKLEPWEQDYYRAHRAQIDLRPRLTAEEQAAKDALNRLLAEGDAQGMKGGTKR